MGEWIVDVISFQKIFGLCGLKCHIVEIWRDVTLDDGQRNVKIELEFWKQNSQYASFCCRTNEPPPKAGRIACPAIEDAANKTAPPPMIPKLLTVTNDKNFTKKLNKENSPPGQSFLQVEKGGSFTGQSSIPLYQAVFDNLGLLLSRHMSPLQGRSQSSSPWSIPKYPQSG